MFTHIKNGIVQLQGDAMHYIRFGNCSKKFIKLPGLGDGLTTVKGTALLMAFMYRAFAKEYTVYAQFYRIIRTVDNVSNG